jgi:dipeptidyl aminopeptidase/acylaminoacyl peptidase
MLAGALLAFVTIAPAQADSANTWPYPEDIPSVEPVTVGLAGEQPADIVRYLMARGALSVALSPDGTQLAYSDRSTGEPQLWIVDATGGWPRQLTFGRGIRAFSWMPDGKRLLVTRDTDGDEREGYYLLSRDGTREQELLAPSDAFRSSPLFSADGRELLYASTERNGRDFDIYRIDTASGDGDVVFQGSFGFYPRAWQPGGSLVIVDEVRGENSNDVHLLDLDTGTLTPLFQPPEPAHHGAYRWLPDGSGFFMTTNSGRDFTAIAFVNLDDRQSTFIETPERDVDDIGLGADGRYLAWLENDDGLSVLKLRDRETGALLQPDGLPAGVYGIGFARRAPSLSIRVSAPAIPGDVYVWDLEHPGTLQQPVRSTLAGLDPETFVEPESLRYAARDGLELQGFLYRPKADLGKLPMVVRVHGGPTAQARPSFRPNVQYLVNQGIAVFDVNVRGSTGFGRRYEFLDNQEKRLDSVRDLVDTADFLRKEPTIRAGRLAVMGGSYGGYMVNAVLGAHPEVFDAGASFVGVSDWVRALRGASPALKASDRIEYGDIREERWQQFYSENSPINTAHRITVPLFVSHGVNDPRDPVTESDAIVQTVRDNGGKVVYLRFPDEGHSISKQSNRVAFGRALMAFLQEQLAGDQAQ